MPKSTKLLLNGDDLIASNISQDNERAYFGIKKMDTDVTECINLINDMRICPKCNSILEYEALRYHHIGKAYCPVCGFKSPECKYEGIEVDVPNMTVKIKDNEGEYTYRLLNDSVFNIYNVVAVVSLFRELGYTQERIAELLEKIEIVKKKYLHADNGVLDSYAFRSGDTLDSMHEYSEEEYVRESEQLTQRFDKLLIRNLDLDIPLYNYVYQNEDSAMTYAELRAFLQGDDAGEDEEGAISEYFTNAQLEQIRQGLGVPDNLPVKIEVSEPYYWEGGAMDLCAVDFYHNENWIAGAACEPHTAETVKDICMYRPES
jgi:hypothetical protein